MALFPSKNVLNSFSLQYCKRELVIPEEGGFCTFLEIPVSHVCATLWASNGVRSRIALSSADAYLLTRTHAHTHTIQCTSLQVVHLFEVYSIRLYIFTSLSYLSKQHRPDSRAKMNYVLIPSQGAHDASQPRPQAGDMRLAHQMPETRGMT